MKRKKKKYFVRFFRLFIPNDVKFVATVITKKKEQWINIRVSKKKGADIAIAVDNFFWPNSSRPCLHSFIWRHFLNEKKNDFIMSRFDRYAKEYYVSHRSFFYASSINGNMTNWVIDTDSYNFIPFFFLTFLLWSWLKQVTKLCIQR